jgi:hypothetical protein
VVCGSIRIGIANSALRVATVAAVDGCRLTIDRAEALAYIQALFIAALLLIT